MAPAVPYSCRTYREICYLRLRSLTTGRWRFSGTELGEFPSKVAEAALSEGRLQRHAHPEEEIPMVVCHADGVTARVWWHDNGLFWLDSPPLIKMGVTFSHLKTVTL